MAAVNRKWGWWAGESKLSNDVWYVCKVQLVCYFPVCMHVESAKSYIYIFLFFFHMGQILISRRQKSLPNVAKYKAKLQPRGRCELSKSRAKLIGAILHKAVGKEKE